MPFIAMVASYLRPLSGIRDPAGPLRALRFHVDQDLFARFLGVAAEIVAALFDANVALVVFGGPDADRRVRIGFAVRGQRERARRSGVAVAT